MRNLTNHRLLAKDQSGVTLVEVMVAGVLVILIMYGLMQIFMRGRRQLDYEEDRRKATAVLQERLDDLRRRPYDTLSDYHGTDTTMTVDGRQYTLYHDVTEQIPNDQATTLTVWAEWQGRINYDPGNTFTRTDTVTTIVGRAFGVSN